MFFFVVITFNFIFSSWIRYFPVFHKNYDVFHSFNNYYYTAKRNTHNDDIKLAISFSLFLHSFICVLIDFLFYFCVSFFLINNLPLLFLLFELLSIHLINVLSILSFHIFFHIQASLCLFFAFFNVTSRDQQNKKNHLFK